MQWAIIQPKEEHKARTYYSEDKPGSSMLRERNRTQKTEPSTVSSHLHEMSGTGNLSFSLSTSNHLSTGHSSSERSFTSNPPPVPPQRPLLLRLLSTPRGPRRVLPNGGPYFHPALASPQNRVCTNVITSLFSIQKFNGLLLQCPFSSVFPPCYRKLVEICFQREVKYWS